MGDIEEQAKAMGWVPKDDFKGNPELWKDAESFVKDGYEVLPILRERLKKVTSTQEETNAKLARTESLLKTLTEHHKKTEESAYKRALADLKAEQRKAVQDNDIETFDKIDEQINKLEKPKEPEGADNLDPEFLSWKAENKWYETDPELSVYADFVAGFVEKTTGLKGGRAFYDKVAEEVKTRYPDKFKNPNREKVDAVEAGGGGDNNAGPTKKGKKTYSNMPQDAKDACDELVRGGVMKKEDYVKEYYELVEE